MEEFVKSVLSCMLLYDIEVWYSSTLSSWHIYLMINDNDFILINWHEYSVEMILQIVYKCILGCVRVKKRIKQNESTKWKEIIC